MAPRTLFVSTSVPKLGNGRELRTYTVVRALAQLGPVDLAYVPHGAPEPSAEFTVLDDVTLHRVEPSRGARRAATYAAARARGMPDLVARSSSPEVLAAARALAAAPDRGRVVAGDIHAMATLLPLARERPVTYNAHNVESSYPAPTRADRLRRRQFAALERRILRTADESWMVSRRDVEQARALAPGAALRYAPNVADVAAIVPEPPRDGGDTAVLLGDFTYAPNVSGLRWLTGEVLPRVWARRPQARLRVCGRGLEPGGVADPRVDVRGFVDDVADAYRGAAAVVVPLVEGAGTPLKFVEALAYGVPIVATPVAARGLEVRDGEHFRLGDGPDAFAAALVELLEAGDAAMARRARALAEAEYSIAALARALDGQPASP